MGTHTEGGRNRLVDVIQGMDLVIEQLQGGVYVRLEVVWPSQ